VRYFADVGVEEQVVAGVMVEEETPVMRTELTVAE
jgi:hypothetical protein